MVNNHQYKKKTHFFRLSVKGKFMAKKQLEWQSILPSAQGDRGADK